jgi:hypothetical protein
VLAQASGEVLHVPEEGVELGGGAAGGVRLRLMPADAAASVGALGVVVSVTLQCISPRFDVQLRER